MGRGYDISPIALNSFYYYTGYIIRRADCFENVIFKKADSSISAVTDILAERAAIWIGIWHFNDIATPDKLSLCDMG